MSIAIRTLALMTAAMLTAAGDARAQSRGKPAAEEQAGLALGTKAPEFTLKDGDGKDRSLGEFLGEGKVALVFYRSADW